jgi:hypothetical protein
MPDVLQQLHEDSLTEGRDILKDADDEEKQKWLTKQGTDWSGAFGHDPKAYLDVKGRKRREPGAEPPLHDPHHPSDDEDNEDDEDDDTSDSSDADLGIQDANNARTSNQMNGTREGASLDSQRTMDSTATTASTADTNKQNKRTEQRKHRGLMQWKPARNAKFAKDEGMLGLRKLKSKVTGGLNGRQPGVETGKTSYTFYILPLNFY